jgi:PAS domain S-box-containing protein
VAPLFLHFAFVLTDAAPGAWRRGALHLSYSLGALFLVLTWSTDLIFREFVVASGPSGYREVGGILRLPSKVFVTSVFLLGITILAYCYSRPSISNDRKSRIGLVIIAAAIPLVTGLVTDILLPFLGREAPFSSLAAGPFMAAVIAYAVTRHDLMKTVIGSLGSSTITRISEAVFVIDSDGLIETINPAAEALSGYTADELAGSPVQRLLTSTPWSKTPGLATSGEESAWCFFNSKGGDSLPVNLSTEPVKKSSGAVIGSVLVIHDMRETLKLVKAEYDAKAAVAEVDLERDRSMTLRRSSQELQTLSNFLENVIDNIAEPIYIKDRNGRYVFVNRRICEMSGLAKEEIVGKTNEDIELIPPETARMVREVEREMIESGAVAVTEYGLIMDTSGGSHFLRSVQTPLKSETGEIEYIVGVASDVTEHKRLDEARLDFIRVAAHELRTPLTSLKLGFDMLARETRGALDKGQQRSLDVLSLSIERLSSLAKNLLDLAGMEAGLLTLDMQPVEIGPVVDEAVSLFSSAVEKKGLYCDVALDGNLRPASVDAGRLSQVLYNLLSNAVKYTEEGGITVSARDPGDGFLEICVADTGVGISAAQHDSIFTSFVKARSTEAGREGTGLGLSITKAIVEAHGGRIRVESAPGEGSKFYFTVQEAEV